MPARKNEPLKLSQPSMSPADSPLADGALPEAAPGNSEPEVQPRWLCSELVQLHWPDAAGRRCTQIVNLEEIWREGAQVEAEEALAEGLSVSLTRMADAGPDAVLAAELHGVIASCLEIGTGFAVEILFSAGSAWHPGQFPPAHALDPVELERKAAEACRETSAPESGNGAPSPSGDDQIRASRARAVAETIEQGSLYRLASHASGR